jgi:hypothetical protein
VSRSWHIRVRSVITIFWLTLSRLERVRVLAALAVRLFGRRHRGRLSSEAKLPAQADYVDPPFTLISWKTICVQVTV